MSDSERPDKLFACQPSALIEAGLLNSTNYESFEMLNNYVQISTNYQLFMVHLNQARPGIVRVLKADELIADPQNFVQTGFKIGSNHSSPLGNLVYSDRAIYRRFSFSDVKDAMILMSDLDKGTAES